MRWLRGLIRRRPTEFVVAGTSIAVAVAFVASLGAFVTQSHAALTERAAASVPVDWQVQVTPQGDVASVARHLDRLSDVRAVEQVSFAHVRSLSATGPPGTRLTGAAYIVSISPRYARTPPGQAAPPPRCPVRLLALPADGRQPRRPAG